MRLSIIAAHSTNRVIGANNKLPWHLPDDLKRFKALTIDHSLIMGRKTFESIGKPLPRRRNIVVTRSTASLGPGVTVAHSVDEALALVASEDEVFIAGGGEIYKQMLDRASRMYLTIVDTVVEGDAYFPDYDASAWREVERIERPRGDLPFSYRFVTLERAESLASHR